MSTDITGSRHARLEQALDAAEYRLRLNPLLPLGEIGSDSDTEGATTVITETLPLFRTSDGVQADTGGHASPVMAQPEGSSRYDGTFTGNLSVTFAGRHSSVRKSRSEFEKEFTQRAASFNPVDRVKKHKFRFGLRFYPNECGKHIKISYGKARYYVHLPRLVVALLTIFFLWAVLHFSVGVPGDHQWVIQTFLLVFISGTVGGLLSVMLRIPALLGILWIAIAYVAAGGPISQVDSAVTKPVKALGLTMILLRGGISVNVGQLRSTWKTVATISVLPLLMEAFSVVALAKHLFDMDWNWAFLYAFTITPLSSSVVVTSCLHLQSLGIGHEGNGPVPLMISAVPFDSSLGILLASMMLEVAIPSGDGLTLKLAPVQVVGGLLAGTCSGFVAEVLVNLLYSDRGPGNLRHSETMLDAEHGTEEDREHRASLHTRTFWLLYGFCSAVMLGCSSNDIEGAGSLFVVSFGITLAHRWRRAREDGNDRRKHFANSAALFWNLLLMPALFSFVGKSVDLRTLFQGNLVPKAAAIIAVGCIARMVGSLICTSRSHMPWRERLVMALGWVGKASAQASLGMAARDRVVAQNCEDDGGNSSAGGSDSTSSAASPAPNITPNPTAVSMRWLAHPDHTQTNEVPEIVPRTQRTCDVDVCSCEPRAHDLAVLCVLMILVAAPISSISIRVLGRKWLKKHDDTPA
jgi:Kef-type K+ transport system membrane component KefB